MDAIPNPHLSFNELVNYPEAIEIYAENANFTRRNCVTCPKEQLECKV